MKIQKHEKLLKKYYTEQSLSQKTTNRNIYFQAAIIFNLFVILISPSLMRNKTEIMSQQIKCFANQYEDEIHSIIDTNLFTYKGVLNDKN